MDSTLLNNAIEELTESQCWVPTLHFLDLSCVVVRPCYFPRLQSFDCYRHFCGADRCIVSNFVMDCSDNVHRALCSLVHILVNLPNGQCYIPEKFMVERFLLALLNSIKTFGCVRLDTLAAGWYE